jgi:uncharacterized integral membrane protein
MADPHHVEPLDGFDRLTVSAYRAGLFVAATGIAGLAWSLTSGPESPGWRWVVYAGVALIVANLHLYDRTLRWFIGAAAWIGALLGLLAPLASPLAGPWLADAGLGFAFVVLSAAALKERYCFRVPIVVLVPPILAASLLPMRLGAPAPAGGLLAGAAAVLLLLAFAKVTMPLHFDIGDKRHYQV